MDSCAHTWHDHAAWNASWHQSVTNQVSFFQYLISLAACTSVCHPEQANAYQNIFIKHYKALYSKYLDIGSVFTDESNVLYDLSTDEACPPTTIDSIISLETMGKQQDEKFVGERLVNRTVPITEKIKLSKLNLMKHSKKVKSKPELGCNTFTTLYCKSSTWRRHDWILLPEKCTKSTFTF